MILWFIMHEYGMVAVVMDKNRRWQQ